MKTNKPQRPKAHLNFFIDHAVREKLELLAAHGHRSLSAECRRGLAAHVAREHKLEEQR
jgi:hypothetical protein